MQLKVKPAWMSTLLAKKFRTFYSDDLISDTSYLMSDKFRATISDTAETKL